MLLTVKCTHDEGIRSEGLEDSLSSPQISSVPDMHDNVAEIVCHVLDHHLLLLETLVVHGGAAGAGAGVRVGPLARPPAAHLESQNNNYIAGVGTILGGVRLAS